MNSQSQTPSPGLTQVLARFIHSATYESLPPEVVLIAKDLVLDQLCIQLACARLPWNRKVYDYVQDSASRREESTVVCYGLRTSAEYAALANATFGNGLDMDDYHPESMTHPGAPVVPSALAVGEASHAGGKEFIAAVATGAEVVVRLGLATSPSQVADRGFHPMNTSGTFGSAAAASRLLRLDLQDTVFALGIAGNHCSGLTEYETGGGDVKRIFSGLGAMGGVRAALLAAKHLSAPSTILEGNRGFLQAYGVKEKDLKKWSKIIDGLGTDFHMLTTHIKLQDSPGSMHARADAITSILRENHIRADEIEEIVIGCAEHSLVHNGSVGPEPGDLVAAQFSAHFNAALAAVKGIPDLNTYLDAMAKGFREPEVLAVSRRVRLVWDKECEEAFPAEFLAKVTITTRDGRSYFARKEPKGSARNPVTHAEVRDKFRRLATPVLSGQRVEHIISVVDEIERLKDISELSRLLVCERG